MINQEKRYHCTSEGVYVYYGSKKHKFFEYPKENVSHQELYENSYKGKRYQEFEDSKYSFEQYRLYNRCLYGLKACTKQEIEQMSIQEKMTIQYNHKKTQQLINLSKWKVTSDIVKSIFTKSFPRLSPCIVNFLNATDELTMEDNREINLGSLNIIGGKEQIFNKLIEMNILPSNFYNLKTT